MSNQDKDTVNRLLASAKGNLEQAGVGARQVTVHDLGRKFGLSMQDINDIDRTWTGFTLTESDFKR